MVSGPSIGIDLCDLIIFTLSTKNYVIYAMEGVHLCSVCFQSLTRTVD